MEYLLKLKTKIFKEDRIPAIGSPLAISKSASALAAAATVSQTQTGKMAISAFLHNDKIAFYIV
jgi:hypothetical protein